MIWHKMAIDARVRARNSRCVRIDELTTRRTTTVTMRLDPHKGPAEKERTERERERDREWSEGEEEKKKKRWFDHKWLCYARRTADRSGASPP